MHEKNYVKENMNVLHKSFRQKMYATEKKSEFLFCFLFLLPAVEYSGIKLLYSIKNINNSRFEQKNRLNMLKQVLHICCLHVQLF